MHVVGVDPGSTFLAAVILSGSTWQIKTQKVPPQDKLRRNLIAYRWMRAVVRELDGPVSLFIELPLFGRGGLKALFALGEIQGALVAGAQSAGVTHLERVNVQTWKRAVVKSGRASKLRVRRHIKKVWPVLYLEADGDQNVMDAAAIALYGDYIVRLRRWDHRPRLTKR